jgi:hypothetical protein
MQGVSFHNVITCALFFGTVLMCAQPALAQTSEGDDKLPVIYGAKLEGPRISIDVVSFGCTDASYFSVQLQPVSADVFRLSPPNSWRTCRSFATISQACIASLPLQSSWMSKVGRLQWG